MITSLKAMLVCAALAGCSFGQRSEKVFDVRDYGATGDGKTIDSPAINNAINAATAAGGGTILIPRGTYLCYSIHLADNISLELEKGSTIKGAQYDENAGFDDAEPNDYSQFQDFGHSHWKNSLIWGIGLKNISICGEGTIDGSLLSDGFEDTAATSAIALDFSLKKGAANKTLALKECHNVSIKGIKFVEGGHFCILATGVDSLSIDGIMVDTNRDGIDIDCCSNVEIKNCEVNSPWDDGIVLKTSFALGRYKACENISISNCKISGYRIGTMLDGTKQDVSPTEFHKNINRRSSGRIKLGTESSGDFRNITVSDCHLEYCGGLHVESTDGAHIENVSFHDITVKDCCDSPIFVMIGGRLRSPEGRTVGIIRNIEFKNIIVEGCRPDYGIILSGYKDNCIENICFRNVTVNSKGGLNPSDAVKEVREMEKAYPDPKSFGTMPSSGMYLRHIRNISIQNVSFSFDVPDSRPLYIKEDCR